MAFVWSWLKQIFKMWNLNTNRIFDDIMKLSIIFQCDHYIMVVYGYYKIRIIIFWRQMEIFMNEMIRLESREENGIKM